MAKPQLSKSISLNLAQPYRALKKVFLFFYAQVPEFCTDARSSMMLSNQLVKSLINLFLRVHRAYAQLAEYETYPQVIFYDANKFVLALRIHSFMHLI